MVYGKVVPDADGNFAATMYSKDEWIFEPGRESRIGWSNLVFSADGRQVKSLSDDRAYGVDMYAQPKFPFAEIVKTYQGVYYTGNDVMSLELAVTSLDEETGKVEAEFRFSPHEHGNPEMPTGSFRMIGQLVREGFSDQVYLVLRGSEWIDNPNNGWDLLNACVSIDVDRCSLTSAYGDRWKIYAEDRSAWRQEPSPMQPVPSTGGVYGDIVKRYVCNAWYPLRHRRDRFSEV